MTRRWFPLYVIGLAILLLPVVGCGPKKPKTPAGTETVTETVVEEEAVEIVPEPEPTPAADVQQSPLDGDLVSATKYAYQQGLLGEIFFEFDKSNLTSEARERLSKNAQFLKNNGSFVVTIEGHCDERGTAEYNIALGERRANAARDYLISLGVSGSRLQTISYGKERPVCSASNETCWSRNRRDYFGLTGRS